MDPKDSKGRLRWGQRQSIAVIPLSEIDDVPPIDPRHMAHFIAIQVAMREDEQRTAREVAAELTPIELREWLDNLSKLSIPQAVQRLRMQFSGAIRLRCWQQDAPTPPSVETDAISQAFSKARETITELEAKRVEHVGGEWSPAQMARAS